ncbi:MAG: hypothetical protein JRG69_11380 [Deltaproteobacteria bacterium]|nr:hypothetical protein [Deltaproteobacteria bacterium]
MATLRSINVQMTCRECGPVEDFTEINGKRFCSVCLAEALEDRLMVPAVYMDTVEAEDPPEGHYFCCHCQQLTKNGRKCDHCGV